jgi:hypothetical protein
MMEFYDLNVMEPSQTLHESPLRFHVAIAYDTQHEERVSKVIEVLHANANKDVPKVEQ